MQDFGKFMRDDAELLRAANAQWAVVPMTNEVRSWGSLYPTCCRHWTQIHSKLAVGLWVADEPALTFDRAERAQSPRPSRRS